MTSLERARLTWHTVRYLRPQQVRDRLWLRATGTARRVSPKWAERHYARAARRLAFERPLRRWQGVPAVACQRGDLQERNVAERRANHAEAGCFAFLNATAQFGRPIDWQASEHSQLWRYHLQYGGYLLDIAATRTDAWPSVAGVIREWIECNPIGRAHDAWHPFVVSERVVNWMYCVLLCGPDNSVLDGPILDSLAMQCAFVDGNLETDVGGNHLLKNLKALAIAGCFWRGSQAERWYVRYTDAFTRELTDQLLADGAHFERSPMYHVLVLQDALELAATIRGVGRIVPPALVVCIRAMVAYLPTITHPDGGIALFSDSVLDEAPTPSSIVAFARRVLDDDREAAGLTTRQAAVSAALVGDPPRGGQSERAATEDSGIVHLSGRAGCAMVDVGRACPDDLPAHAHADLFGFELSFGEHRFIVDSGVGEYRAGHWREYYRSTRAHNTVQVDGIDQIECWDSFRVGRRARIVHREVIDTPLLRGVRACHTGYERLTEPVRAWRSFLELAGCSWIVLDSLEGSGTHAWESYLHAAPDVEVSLEGDCRARFRRGARSLAVAWYGAARASIVRGVEQPAQGWYAPEFGRHLPASVLVLEGYGAVPIHCGYVIAADLPATSRLALERDAVGVTVTIDTACYRLSVDGTHAAKAASSVS